MPEYYRKIVAEQRGVLDRIKELDFELDNLDDYGFHDCDCEYCPVEELPEPPKLTEKQRKEREAARLDLERSCKEYEVTIKRLERYAKSSGIKLKSG